MQTFLPYPDSRTSSVVLDDRRLGKQRVETLQILRALTWANYGWQNHPAVQMWRGFVPALVAYGLENCAEWSRRGYADSVADQLVEWTGGRRPRSPQLPPWWGWDSLHRSHRAALLRKDREVYGRWFADEPTPTMPYVWPGSVFPRWPVRSAGATLGLVDALHELGFDEPRAGQAEAAGAVATGNDVLLVMRPGAGASSTGVLAGLMTTGRTAWVHRMCEPLAAPAPQLPVRTRSRTRKSNASPFLPPTARSPTAADLEAMRAEAQPPEFVFMTPDSSARHRATPFGLIVLDRLDNTSVDRSALALPEGVPRLAIVERADPTAREALVSDFGLRDPVHVGAGWDPGSVLDADAPHSAQAATRIVAQAVRERPPALVVCPSRSAADRRAARLGRTGLRVATWAPPPMRRTRAAGALAAWQGKKLDALVVPATTLPDLGRRRPAVLVGEDVASLDLWRETIARVGAPESLLVAGPGAPHDVRHYARSALCLRRALLDLFGEPIRSPCGTCSRCR